jgi:hypothetical protein
MLLRRFARSRGLPRARAGSGRWRTRTQQPATSNPLASAGAVCCDAVTLEWYYDFSFLSRHIQGQASRNVIFYCIRPVILYLTITIELLLLLSVVFVISVNEQLTPRAYGGGQAEPRAARHCESSAQSKER